MKNLTALRDEVRGRIEPIETADIVAGIPLDILTPLYYAHVASFARTVENMSAPKGEEEIERQAMFFEDEKPYLLERWKIADEAISMGSMCGQPI